jgi:glutamate N-acetyltransferase/amino-acid N-acetyltransferase
VNLPLGYRYSATYAGIRRDARDDLALIVSGVPAAAAAVFTQNRVQAAPVRIGRFHLTKSRGIVSAVLINAGNANCATRTGDRVALACCDAVGKQLHVPPEQVFPASTGVIGVELDAHLILEIELPLFKLPFFPDGVREPPLVRAAAEHIEAAHAHGYRYAAGEFTRKPFHACVTIASENRLCKPCRREIY